MTKQESLFSPEMNQLDLVEKKKKEVLHCVHINQLQEALHHYYNCRKRLRFIN